MEAVTAKTSRKTGRLAQEPTMETDTLEAQELKEGNRADSVRLSEEELLKPQELCRMNQVQGTISLIPEA